MNPTQKASHRTKERFKLHAPFQIIDRDGECSTFPGRQCILIASERTDWFGWIPLDELENVPQVD